MNPFWFNRLCAILFPVTLSILEWLSIKNLTVSFGIFWYCVITLIRFVQHRLFGYDKNDASTQLSDSFFPIGFISAITIFAGLPVAGIALFFGSTLGIACCYWCTLVFELPPENSRHNL